MTTITDGKESTVAKSDNADDALLCIGAMARILKKTLHIRPAPECVGVDLPRNVNIEGHRPPTLIARP